MLEHKSPSHWKKDIAPYEKPIVKTSIMQIINTIVPFFLLWFLAYQSLSISYWLTLPLVIVASGFVIRTFIIFHDCCHHSFFRSRLANDILGNITGVLTFTPYRQWRNSHTIHHATSSNLNKRGEGDIWVLTVDEYIASPLWRRIMYRIYRNPFVLFGFGPFYLFLVSYRFNRKNAKTKERINTYLINLAIVGTSALCCWLLGWQAFLLIQGPIFYLSGLGGIWLFYVQHQFEDSYYEHDDEWEYVRAAIDGSSYYKLPRILQWLTGNIGFHHVHHLSPRVPNYFLEEVHDTTPLLSKVNTITLKTSIQSIRFHLWSEQDMKFKSFKDIKPLLAMSRRTATDTTTIPVPVPIPVPATAKK
ncbi:fatty acid desaturase [Paenibacillus mendelii]|uniref:Fatty acid desaturase n=1 Tax=Paenibacillus mendelii TaxID=206163 RepID=A0ABV6J8D5_9BACL|nr:fatty acid desaturase [Paenibacillus mendelii]MCQ6562073.1 fatty acid desaturase [Paenibacillus mendelii]